MGSPAWAAVPTTPTNSSPLNGVWENSLTLTGSAYADPDGSAQVGAEFQVRTSTGAYGDATSMGSGTLGMTNTWTAPTATNGVTYFWRVRYSDASGWSAWSAETSFTFDNVVPSNVPTITLGGTQTTGVFTLSWGTATDATSGLFGYDVESKQFPTPYQYSRLYNTDPEATPPVAFFSPQTCTVGPGTYTMRVRAVDGAHNHSATWLETAASFTVTANGALPVLAAPTVSPAPFNNNTMNLSWTAGAGATGYIISQSNDSGATWRQVTIVPSTSTTYAYAPWTDGNYIFRISVADASSVGNWSASSSSVLYDVTDPNQVTNHTVTPSISNGPAFTISWTDAGDPVVNGVASGIAYTAVMRAPQGSSTWTTLLNAVPPTTTTTDTPPSDGRWRYRVKPYDAAGNSGSSSYLTVTRDTVAPTAPGQPSASPSPGPVPLTWTAATDATSGVASYVLERSTNGTTFTRVATGIPTSSTTDAVGEGQYWYRVAAVDAAGWEGPMSPISLPILVDATAPLAPTGVSVTPALSSSGQLQVAWTGNGDPTSGGVSSGVAFYELQRAPAGSGTWTLLAATPAASPVLDTPVDGSWDYRVRAVDGAGNRSLWSGIATATSDTTPPIAPGAPTPLATATNGTVSLTWAAALDATSGVASYGLERSSDGGITWILVASGIAGTSTTDAPFDGQYLYRVLATDVAGLASAPSLPSVAVLVDRTAPSIPTSPSVSPALSTNGQLTVSWTNAGDPLNGGVASGVTAFGIRRAPGGTGVWTVLTPPPAASPVLDTPPSDGAWDYQVRAVDAVGNVSGWTTTVTASVDTTAPGAPGAPVPSPTTTNGSVSLTWTAATDTTSGIASYQLDRTANGGGTWTSVATGIAGTSANDAPAADGRYAYRVRATDGAGHPGAFSPASVDVIIDKTAPSTPTGPALSPALSGTGQFTVSWTNAGDPVAGGVSSGVARFQIRRSPGGANTWTTLAATPAASPLVDTAPGDGNWDYQVRAVDAAGNVSAWTVTVTGCRDTTPPTAPGTPVPSVTLTNGSLSLSWTAATDATSSVASYALERSADNGATWTTAASGIVGLSANDAPAADGRYLYRVKATDAAGNVGPASPNSVAVVVDKTAPSAPTSPAVAPALSGNGQLTVSWTNAGDPLAGGVASGVVRFELRRSPGGASTWTTLGTSPAASPLIDTAPGDGYWDYQVRAVDAAGNVSAWSLTATGQVDTTPPGTPGAPVPTPTLTNGTISLSWAAASDASGVASYTLERSGDGGITWGAIAFGIAGTSTTDAPFDGQYLYRVKATDLAGHTGAPSLPSVQVTVDLTAPSIPTSPSVSPAVSGNGQLTVSWVNAGDPLSGGVASGVARFQIRRSPGGLNSWTTLGATPVASPLVDTPPSDGDWDYQVRAVDAAGNLSGWTATASARVDTVAPGAPGTPVPAATPVNGPVSLSWTAATDATSGVASYELQRSANGGATWTSAATGIVGTSTTDSPADGQYVYRVRAVDAAGHPGPFSTASAQVLVDLTSPAVPTSPAVSPPLSGDGVLTVSWTNAGDPLAGGVASGVARFEIQRSPGGANTWTTLATTPAASPLVDTAPGNGAWDYQVRAVDAAGNRSAWSATASASVSTGGPSAPGTPIPGATIYAGPVSLTWAPATGGSGTIASYDLERSADNGVTWASAAIGLPGPSAIDAPSDGRYVYRARATDTAAHVGPFSASSVQVLVDLTAPSIPSAPALAPALSANGQLTLSWTNSGDPLAGGVASGVARFEIRRSPGGASTWTTLATTPAASPLVDTAPSDGDWDYQVRAVDAAGNRSGWSATASARADTTPPSSPGAPVPSATLVNGPVSLSWSAASDATSGVASYDLQRSGDNGITWNAVAFALAGTSTTDSPSDGRYLYRVIATDLAGHAGAPSLPSVAITVDLTAPGIPASFAPSSPISATGQIDLTWAAATDPLVNSVASGVAHYELRRAPFGTTAWIALAPNPTAAAFTDSPGDGHWQYQARTLDVAGNASGWSTTAGAFVDTVAPSAPGAPVPAAAVTRNPVSLSWSAATDATTGVASYSLERSPDLSTWSEVATGIASSPASDPAPEGTFYYRIVALDGAANRSPPSPTSVQVIVDKTPPETPAAPTAGPTPSSGPVTVSWVAVADVGLAGMASYRIERSPDGSAWTAAATVPSIATTYDDAPPTGTWVYRVVAIDAAGNEATSPASSQPVQVDSTPTKLAFTTGPSQVNVGECVPLTIQTRNAFDVPASPAANVTVTLGGSASVSLFSDGACTVPASSVVILAGTTQVSYSWSSSAAGTATLTGSAAPLAGASQDYTVLQIQGGACSAGGQCATGVCADNVCCNVACTGGCESCNQAGNVGTCRPWAALSDPEGACGTGACGGTCDGAGACSYPVAGTSCGTCQACNGSGACGNAQDGTSCADTSYCNGAEVCQGGACQPATPVTCAPSGSDVLACDEASQSCQVQSQSPPVIVHDAHPDGAVGIPYAYNAAGKITVLGPRPMQFSACAGVPPEFHVEPRTGAVSFVPTAAGTASLCVRVDNAHGWDSYSFPVQVAATAPADPIARIVATNAAGIAPLTVTLDGSTSTSSDASPLHAWRWREGHFGPRRFTTAIDAHYLLPGGYLGELRVVDRAGRIGSAVQQIQALTAQGHRPPSAQIVASALQGDNALEVDLSCNCTAGDNPIRGLLWRLSTGETLQGSNVHVSLGPGRHHALLEVVDAEGLSAFAKQELVVTSAGKLPPECEVTADPPALAAPAPVTYEAALSPSSADIATLELRAGTTTTDQPTLTLQENTPGRVETFMQIVDLDGLACADVGLVRLTDGQSRLPPAIHSHATGQASCGIPYSYGTALPVVSGTGAFGFSLQGAPEGLTVKPDTGEIFWIPSRTQAGPHDFTLVAASAAGSASEDIHVDVACGPADDLRVVCGCTSAGEAPLVLAALAAAWAAWRRRRSG